MYRNVLAFLCALGLIGGGVLAGDTVRPPAVSCQFYPSDSVELAHMVAGHLAKVVGEAPINGRILAVIVPHAGLVYSGQTAAYAYKLLENRGFTNVVLCGPTHRYAFQGVSVYGPDIVWQTPLGQVRCNRVLCEDILKRDPDASVVAQAHAREHCLEVQLPYLQTVLPNMQIVPVVMGSPDKAMVERLSQTLAAMCADSSVVMVASTDWQHYRPAAAGRPMDSLGMDCLTRLDPDRLLTYLAEGKVEACGGGPAVAVLKAAMALGANRVKILKYTDSGDLTGDKSSVVGYVAAVVYREADGKAPTPKQGSPNKESKKAMPAAFQLSDSDKTKLLEIARKTIESYLAGAATPEFAVPDNLRQPGACFVTLKKGEMLRGCIGRTVAVDPLYQTVSQCAIDASVSDPRFPAVQASELPQLDLEISVLTPLEKVQNLEEITVGRDGLMIAMGRNRGLLLPQVATEYGWSRTEFLEATCRKAGLPLDAYKDPAATVYSFRAIVFGEK
jgi:AmmeMemoRadiSam system protein B/AmmeMemoRadiSam system protein A